MKITVIGSGAWGTALSILLNSNGHDVFLWSHNPKKAAEMVLTRENPLLKGVHISDAITITSDLNCLNGSEIVVFATPSFALRETARLVKDHLPENAVLVSVTKGIEPGSNLRMSEIIADETGHRMSVVVLSGPSHAEEVSRHIPTGCVAAAEREEDAAFVQQAFLSDNFRVYTHDDMAGVELCGAFKNIVALCCGILEGYGLGDNAKALLMTRSMAELSKLVKCLGGRLETLAGLAGMGDLIVTCTSIHSRNHRFGILLGQGKSVSDAKEEVGAVVEGYYAAQSALELAKKKNIDLPICNAAYQVLYHNADVGMAICSLMERPAGKEHERCWLS